MGLWVEGKHESVHEQLRLSVVEKLELSIWRLEKLLGTTWGWGPGNKNFQCALKVMCGQEAIQVLELVVGRG